MPNTFGRAAAYAAAAFMLAAGVTAAQDLKPVKVISSLPTLTSAAVYLMKARGYDKAHGLDVEIQQSGGSSTLQVDAVIAGDAMFGGPGTATALQAIRAGGDIVILGAAANNQIAGVISNDALAKAGVALDAPIEDRIKALKGLTIGTNPVGSTYYLMLRTELQQVGLDPDNDVRLVGVTDSNALITGMDQGRFDVIVSASGIVEQAISLGAGQLLYSGARGDFPGGDSTMVLVTIARSDTVKDHPDIVEAYRAALADALTALNEDHAEAGKLLREQFFGAMSEPVWASVWANATKAYPTQLLFPKSAYDFWIQNDAKGPDSYKDIDYSKIVYGPAQVN